MKSDIIRLDKSSSSAEKALDHIEKLADSFGFDSRDAAIARLLAEEAISSFSNIIGLSSALIWVETLGNNFEIHLKTNANLSTKEREDLIELSKSKKNTPKKGLIGKLASFIDYIASDKAVGEDCFMFYNMCPEMGVYTVDITQSHKAKWSYQNDKKNFHKKIDFPDIEKTLLERYSDDIIISIAIKDIELTIVKARKQT